MSHINSHSNYINLFAVTLLIVISHSAAADTIANKPLYLENDNAIEPNIMFTIDDSGSMSDTYLSADNKKPSDWQYYASAYNKLYYDPAVHYLPWVNADGSEKAKATPQCNATSYQQWERVNGKWVYTTYYTDDRNDYDCFYYDKDGNFIPIYDQVNNYSSSPDRDDCSSSSNCTFAQESQNFANWKLYYSTRMNAAKAGIGRAFYELNDKVRVGYGQINSSSRTVDGVDTTTLRSGVRKYSSTVKSNFFDWLYNIPKTSSGTPLRRAMDDVGIYYSRAKGQYSPWADNPGDANYGGFKTCRQSYHILMTDGYWKDAAATIATGNQDGTDGELITNDLGGTKIKYEAKAPYSDTSSNTLADVAAYYWKKDLQNEISNKVPPSSSRAGSHFVNEI